MGQAAKNEQAVRTEAPIDVTRARLVRRGPGRVAHLTLRSLREAEGLTQAQVAKACGFAQPDVSKLENAASLDDRMIATLRRYLGAIGDDLDLVAASKHGHRVAIVGVGSVGAGSVGAARDAAGEGALPDLLRDAARVANARARTTATAHDIGLALLLEAVAHLERARGKRGAGLVHAAEKYLEELRPIERLDADMAAASKWTDELRVYVGDALASVRRGGNATGAATHLCEMVLGAMPIATNVLAKDAAPGVAKALVATPADAEAVLRALLKAVGVSPAAEVQRLTKAAYMRARRIQAKKRAAKSRAK